MCMHRIGLAALVALFATTLLPAQQPAVDVGRIVDSAAHAEMRRLRAPGMVVALVGRDSVVARRAYGVANIETGEPMSADMLVSVASVSKLVTAITAVVLSSQNMLSLDAPISTYLPWVAPELGALTMSQLLSHTAGLGERTPSGPVGPGIRMEPVCRAMTGLAIVAPVASAWGYSNSGYVLAGCVIEAVAKAPFPQVVAQTVLGPVGMSRSTYNPLVAMTMRHAQGHDTRTDPATLVRPYNSAPSFAPAGELITTVDDLARLARALLSDGRLGTSRVLPPNVLRTLTKVRGHGGAWINSPRDYGFGLFVRPFHSLLIAEHEGFYAGFGASFSLEVNKGLAAIAVTNGRYSAPMRTTQAALEALAGLRPTPDGAPTITIPAGDSAAAIGRYAALADTVEIATVGARLSLRRGPAVQSIVGRSSDWWALPGYPAYLPHEEAPLEIATRDVHGHVAFIRIGWRLYQRVE